MKNNNKAPIVIIGGGIIGASVAYHLASLYAIKDVTVLEKSRIGSGSTSASMGGFRHQFSSETAIKLSIESVKVLEDFENSFGYDPLIKRDGYCFVASQENSLKTLQKNRELARNLGIDVELLDQEELQRRFPFYSFDGILGGTLCVQDGHASTLAVLQGYVSKAKSLGVKFFENDAVTEISIQKENEKVDSVATSQGQKFQTSKVLIAAGAYSGLVGKLAQINIPIKPYPRKVLVTASFTDSIPELIPIIVDVDSTLAVGREGRGIIFADNEPIGSSFELKFPPEYDERVISKAVQRVSSLSKASVAYANMGLYELAPDANPIVSEIQGIDGLYCCAGFAGHGFMHAPAIGKIMAELMIDERTHLDISEYNLRRFFSSNNNEEKQQQASSSERLII